MEAELSCRAFLIPAKELWLQGVERQILHHMFLMVMDGISENTSTAAFKNSYSLSAPGARSQTLYDRVCHLGDSSLQSPLQNPPHQLGQRD